MGNNRENNILATHTPTSQIYTMHLKTLHKYMTTSHVVENLDKTKTRETHMKDLKGDPYIIWVSQLSFVRTST